MSFDRMDKINELWDELHSIITLSEIAEDLNEEDDVEDDTIYDVRKKRSFAIHNTFVEILKIYEEEVNHDIVNTIYSKKESQ